LVSAEVGLNIRLRKIEVRPQRDGAYEGSRGRDEKDARSQFMTEEEMWGHR
jgi:hypothetical protein